MRITEKKPQYASEASRRNAMKSKTLETSRKAEGRRPTITIVMILLISGSKVMPQMTMTRGKRLRLIKSVALLAF